MPKNDAPYKALVEAFRALSEAIHKEHPLPDFYPEFVRLSEAVDGLSQPQHGGLVEALADPNAVHVNMLRGAIAKPSIRQIIHIYGENALREALASNIPVGEDDDLTDEQWAEAVERAPKPNGPLTEISPTDTDDRREAIINAITPAVLSREQVGEDSRAYVERIADALIAASLIAVPDGMEWDRRTVARCIQIVRERRDDFLDPDYTSDQPVGSFVERFAADQCAEAIENEFAIGTSEQRALLGLPSMAEEYRAMIAAATGEA